VDAAKIRYGLGGIKGTGAQAIEAIVAAREAGGAVRDLFDFLRRIDKRHSIGRAVEALVKAGAFDAIERHRGDALRFRRHRAERCRKGGTGAAQVSLFGDPREDARRSLVAVARMDGERASRARKNGRWLLPFGPSVHGVCARARAAHPAAALRAPTEEGDERSSPAS
jgi:DNA polymerase-3 subunit alpha